MALTLSPRHGDPMSAGLVARMKPPGIRWEPANIPCERPAGNAGSAPSSRHTGTRQPAGQPPSAPSFSVSPLRPRPRRRLVVVAGAPLVVTAGPLLDAVVFGVVGGGGSAAYRLTATLSRMVICCCGPGFWKPGAMVRPLPF